MKIRKSRLHIRPMYLHFKVLFKKKSKKGLMKKKNDYFDIDKVCHKTLTMHASRCTYIYLSRKGIYFCNEHK